MECLRYPVFDELWVYVSCDPYGLKVQGVGYEERVRGEVSRVLKWQLGVSHLIDAAS